MRTVRTSSRLRIKVGGTVMEIGPTEIVNILPDGVRVPAAPHDTASYRETAASHGYGADTIMLCREHEIMHNLLAAWLGLPESPTMRQVAGGGLAPTPLSSLEEGAVLAIQRFTRALGVDLLHLALKDKIASVEVVHAV